MERLEKKLKFWQQKPLQKIITHFLSLLLNDLLLALVGKNTLRKKKKGGTLDQVTMFFRKRLSSLGDRVVAAVGTQGPKYNKARHTKKF